MNGDDALALCELMAKAEKRQAYKDALEGFAVVLRRVLQQEVTRRLKPILCSKCGKPALVTEE